MNKKGMTSRGLALETLVQWTGSGKPVQGFINRIIHVFNLLRVTGLQKIGTFPEDYLQPIIIVNL